MLQRNLVYCYVIHKTELKSSNHTAQYPKTCNRIIITSVQIHLKTKHKQKMVIIHHTILTMNILQQKQIKLPLAANQNENIPRQPPQRCYVVKW